MDSPLPSIFAGKSVICARATPKQKAMVVHSIKKRSPPNQVAARIRNYTCCCTYFICRLSPRLALLYAAYQVTAAIGDGANDVPMIMEVPNRFM